MWKYVCREKVDDAHCFSFVPKYKKSTPKFRRIIIFNDLIINYLIGKKRILLSLGSTLAIVLSTILQDLFYLVLTLSSLLRTRK